MTENVQITLIIVSGIVIVLLLALWMLKDKLDTFSFSANEKGLDAKLKGHTNINISENEQENQSRINIEVPNATIEKNKQKDRSVIHSTMPRKNQ